MKYNIAASLVTLALLSPYADAGVDLTCNGVDIRIVGELTDSSMLFIPVSEYESKLQESSSNSNGAHLQYKGSGETYVDVLVLADSETLEAYVKVNGGEVDSCQTVERNDS